MLLKRGQICHFSTLVCKIFRGSMPPDPPRVARPLGEQVVNGPQCFGNPFIPDPATPLCTVPAESHSICTDRRRPGPAAGLQVSPTSDTCQSVAILMNRRHFSATKVTSLPSVPLSLCLSFSLSLSLSLSHRAHLTHNIGSASALPIIERERERVRESETDR